MIVVIQCAASKVLDAGALQRTDGQKLFFVADPATAPADTPYAYARPDDISDSGRSWRKELLQYNNAPGNNPLGLLPAWQLYQNQTYALLAKKFGSDRLYILSAGWGLITAEFLTPKYDITFSAQADDYKRRRKGDRFDDFRMLPSNSVEPIVFFVSKEYVQLACTLSDNVKGPRYLFYSSKIAPRAPGCTLVKYDTRTRTNWQYECAKAFIDGKIEI